MQRKTVTIATSMVPSQEHTRQGFVNPGQFGPTDWMWSASRTASLDWQPGNSISSSDNYFSQGEGYQSIKNGMFNPLTGQEPVYGHVNYRLNPLNQEQTMAHMQPYALQKESRVLNNISPAGVMRYPPFTYPSNGPPNGWANHFNGSMRR